MSSPEETATFSDLTEGIHAQLVQLRNDLPEPLHMRFDANKFSAAHLACVLAGSLIYRALELGEDALELLNKKNLVGSALLSRAVLESAATMHALKRNILNRDEISEDELHNQIENLAFGSRIIDGMKSGDTVIPKTTSVLTHLSKLLSKEPTVMDNYDFMSELAHPNSASVMGMFCKFDQENSITIFGGNHSNVDLVASGAAMNLMYALRVFSDEYFDTRKTAASWLGS